MTDLPQITAGDTLAAGHPPRPPAAVTSPSEGDVTRAHESRPDVMSVFSWLPGLQAVRSYRREWLAKDVVQGVQ
jgi:hypothetical protein